jgi:hypothetical protein
LQKKVFIDCLGLHQQSPLYERDLKKVIYVNIEGDVMLVDPDNYYDAHAVAGLLKLFFRELAEPICTNELRNELFRLTGSNVLN